MKEIRNFKIGDMVGLTATKVENVNNNDEMLRFHFDNGLVVSFQHWHTCCESVYIESIVGDLDDLVGNPLVVAEEVSNDIIDDKEVENGITEIEDGWGDIEEWTFYKFDTIKGGVTVRWYGTSNGYYSTNVSLGAEYTNE